ncbi:Orotidine 5'-phosphate decarboxylase [Trichinella pseudospiralis]|uniref:Uncharacterized protein n=1 Tax=Trichinella pseudospiralis TaxID=6337 RepID=A0A0V1FT79_TRIPS|nr:hypothetical protein T4D_13268 [Trichinella pseudospiralis]
MSLLKNRAQVMIVKRETCEHCLVVMETADERHGTQPAFFATRRAEEKLQTNAEHIQIFDHAMLIDERRVWLGLERDD